MIEYGDFYLEKPLGNNSFSFEKRKNKKLYIPKLKYIHFNKKDILDSVVESEEIGFSEIFEKGCELNFFGLKNFIETKYKNKKAYIFDNHNHAFFFISYNILKKIKLKQNLNSLKDYLEIENKEIEFLPTMIHFDQHKDMRRPEIDLKNIIIENKESDEKILCDYTNNYLNVGNFIVPLLENGFIKDVEIIDSSYSMENLEKKLYKLNNILLDIDLDFFSKEMDYIEYKKKTDLIKKCIKNSKIITIATSPYFIEFCRSKKVLHDILYLIENS